ALISSARSSRTSGSPPEKPSWAAPSARAWLNTSIHWAVVSSCLCSANSSGLEQYGHCSGQRYVNSANSHNGGPCSGRVRLSAETDPVVFMGLPDKSQHIV